MELSNTNIQEAIDNLFDISIDNLNEKIINAFIPFGGITELPSQQFHTLAFTDELGELVEYLREFTKILKQFDNYPKKKARIILQMYCRIIENDFQYLIIYNLLRLLNNFNLDWEFKTVKNGKDFYCENPTSKIDEICTLCKSGKLTIGKILKNLLKADLRNSFYHSQYCMLPNGSFVNTRFYSPSSKVKPSKKVYKLSEIISIYNSLEYFFDNFFRRFYFELKKFKNGKDYILIDRRVINWDINNNRWIVYKS